MDKQDFYEFTPWEDDPHYVVWINGIYKIKTYHPGQYLAFYIVDGDKNWGDYVEQPPALGAFGRVWESFDDAFRACKRHSILHNPRPATVKRASELLDKIKSGEVNLI